MNFLAHLHLSYPNKPEMVGNFIGDYVKGKQYENFEDIISRGIMLHRHIDTFTDAHPLHKATRERFRKPYGLYSGVVVDMIFDHFLAKNWHLYNELSFHAFTQMCYNSLEEYYTILPERVQGFLPKMKAAKRLESYAELEGLEDALALMSNYTSLPPQSKVAMIILRDNYEDIEQDFKAFYKDLMENIQSDTE